MLNIQRLFKSFKYAYRGLVEILKTEQNMRVHIIAAVCVAVMMFYFDTSIVEKSLLIFAVFLVIASEIINSVVERVIDMLRPRLHPEAKRMKDIMASLVLLAAFGAVLVGLIIFTPKLIAMFVAV